MIHVRFLAAFAALSLAACPFAESSPTATEAFTMTGTWVTLETQVNVAKTTCSLQYNLVLNQDVSGVVTGSVSGNLSVPCVREPKTALDSAQRVYDPFWGTTIVSIAPVSVSGYVSGNQVSLDLRSAAWHLVGTGSTSGGPRVSGSAIKRDNEFPPDSAYSGTFSMTKLGSG